MEVAQEQGIEGANASRMLTKANLSYKTYQGFITKLLQTGLLDMVVLNGDSRAYVLTEKGRHYLNRYEEFELVASSFGLVDLITSK